MSGRSQRAADDKKDLIAMVFGKNAEYMGNSAFTLKLKRPSHR
jgi:hypothetical protein